MPAISESKYLVMAGWDHVPHLDETTKRELLDSTPIHLRDARSKGLPIAGSGLIFAGIVPENEITIEPFEIPHHWPRIAGLDFGWDHPTASAWLAWDRDNDVVYLYDTLKKRQTLIPVICSGIKSRGQWIPMAWPQDGYQVKDAMTGEQIAEQYRREGVNMLHEHAQFLPTNDKDRPSSLVSVEAGIQDMLTRMQSGRFRVFKNLEDWLSEYRLYRREDGLIVKVNDDCICASRYGLMMLRYAVTERRQLTSIERFLKKRRRGTAMAA